MYVVQALLVPGELAWGKRKRCQDWRAEGGLATQLQSMTRAGSHRLALGMLIGHLNSAETQFTLARGPRFQLVRRSRSHARGGAVNSMVGPPTSHLQPRPAVCNEWHKPCRPAGAGSVRAGREVAFFDNFTQSECADLAVHETRGSLRHSARPKAASAKMPRISGCLVLRWAHHDSRGRTAAYDGLPRKGTSFALAALTTGAKRAGGTRANRAGGWVRPKAHVPREGFETCWWNRHAVSRVKAEGTRSPRGV